MSRPRTRAATFSPAIEDASSTPSINPGDSAAAADQLQSESQAAASQQIRNPRRRRRNQQSSNGNGDSVDGTTRQPRKRSRLASDHFVPTGSQDGKGVLNSTGLRLSNGANGHGNTSLNGATPESGKDRDIPMRTVSGAHSRAQIDAGTVLVTNDDFTVQTSSSIPEKFRKFPSGQFNLSLRLKQHSSHAIAVNAESVLVWDCSTPGSSTHTRSFTLPPPHVKSNERPPLACLVSSPSSGGIGGSVQKDFGLAIVYPRTGAITFWESIDSAESLKLFEYRRGQGGAVEGQIKLSVGEQVEHLIETDTAGMVFLYTSAGRIAQLSLRGAYGSANLDVQILHNPSLASRGLGLFGDLVHVFQGIGGDKNKVAALRTRSVTKGRMEVVSLAPDGTFRVWETSEVGQPSFSGAIEAGVDFRNALVKSGMLEELTRGSSTRFLDTVLLLRGDSQTSAIRALVLAQADGTNGNSRLFVLEVKLTSEQAVVERIVPIGVYEPTKSARPKLLITQNERTVFVLDGSIVSMIFWPETPVEGDYPVVQSLHQDLIRLRDDLDSEVIAYAADPPNPYKHSKDVSSIMLFIKPSSILRVSTKAMASEMAKREFPIAKVKIEQAVYFGNLNESVVDLKNISNFAYSSEEIGEAALEISRDILDTQSNYLPQQPASMEQHLALRSKTHKDLANYLRRSGFDLPKDTKWKLMLDGEKLAAARAIWQAYENNPPNPSDDSHNLLEEATRLVLKQKKHVADESMDAAAKENTIRLWFTKHVSGIERLFRAACSDIKKATSEMGNSINSVEHVVNMFRMVFGALHAGFNFRQSNALIYGLAVENLDGFGMLESGYESLPPLWTSSSDVARAVHLSIEVGRPVIRMISLKDKDSKGLPNFLRDGVKAIKEGMEDAVRIACRVYIEQYRWLMASNDADNQNKGLEAKTAFETTIRRKWIMGMYSIGQSEKGLAIAEEQGDVASLVEVGHLEYDEITNRMRRDRHDPEKLAAAEKRAERLGEAFGRYYQKFGERFAMPFYAGYLVSGRQSTLLRSAIGTQELRTKFFRSDPAIGKLAWMNEVLNENGPKSLQLAGAELLDVAKNTESNAWSRRMELSVAKLALLAYEEADDDEGKEIKKERETGKSEVERMKSEIERECIIVEAQRKTYEQVRRVTVESVDREAIVDNVMSTFGGFVLNERPKLAQMLRLGFSDLITHRVMSPSNLIDVLTLMDPAGYSGLEKDDINGKQFLLALQVLKAAEFPADMENMLRKLIWKRCFLRSELITFANLFGKKRDSELEEQMRQTVAFETILRGIQSDFFLTPHEPLIPLPSQVIGAGSSAKDFEGRFPDDQLRVPIARENASDDQDLSKVLKKIPKLDDVVKGIYDLAVREAQELAGEEIAKTERFVKFLKRHDEQKDYGYAVRSRLWDEPESESEYANPGDGMEIEEMDEEDQGDAMEE